MQENPAAAQGALRDPFINEAINKLIAAGIVKMGWWRRTQDWLLKLI